MKVGEPRERPHARQESQSIDDKQNKPHKGARVTRASDSFDADLKRTSTKK